MLRIIAPLVPLLVQASQKSPNPDLVGLFARSTLMISGILFLGAAIYIYTAQAFGHAAACLLLSLILMSSAGVWRALKSRKLSSGVKAGQKGEPETWLAKLSDEAGLNETANTLRREIQENPLLASLIALFIGFYLTEGFGDS